jgi:hypothetical protein
MAIAFCFGPLPSVLEDSLLVVQETKDQRLQTLFFVPVLICSFNQREGEMGNMGEYR